MIQRPSRPSENNKLKIMDLQFKKWIIGLSYALVALALPAMSQDQNQPDSLPVFKELVIATINSSQPDSASRAIPKADLNIVSSPAIIKKESSISDLHPMAIAFVKDYLDENTERLEKMKGSSGAQFRMIDNIFTRYQLPSELKYLAVIESNMKSSATSNKGAVGPWQFMPETGRLMGLKINGTRDDRKDLYKSSHAAAKYLRDLHKQLGDWLLVIAAYNGGPARVESAIRKSRSRDFWKLQYYLPAESRNHVKKFIATHYIMEGQGGVTTTVAADLPGLVNQTIDESLLAGTEMQLINGKYHSMIVAKNLSMDIISFNALNPGFDAKVGIGEYPLRLPADKMQLFNANKIQVLGESVQFMLTNSPDDKDKFPEEIKLPAPKKAIAKTNRK
jgi:membrane-bound lytic murein transglycosylase D